MRNKPRVLFLCTGNSCRSQIAEGWTRYLLGDQVEACSAGVEVHGLNPWAVRVMAEVGVDISRQRSSHIDEFRGIALELVVTVCARADESCPVFPPGCRVVHHGFDDPPKLARELEASGAGEEAQLDCYRRVRDEIRAFVITLPGLLRKGA